MVWDVVSYEFYNRYIFHLNTCINLVCTCVYIINVLIFIAYIFISNKDEITLERIITAKVMIFGGPRRKFTASEVTCEHSLILQVTLLHCYNNVVLENIHPPPTEGIGLSSLPF